MNSGDTASATCTIAKGDVPIRIVWFLNDRPVSDVAGILTNRIGKRITTLSIDSVDAHHVGAYTCSATNKAGVANYTTRLVVNGIIERIFF